MDLIATSAKHYLMSSAVFAITGVRRSTLSATFTGLRPLEHGMFQVELEING